MRENNPLLKTQIRFTNKDVALFMKINGTVEPFVEIDLCDLEVRLPGIDYNVKWNMISERPPIRRVSPERRNIVLKSLGGAAGPVSNPSEPRQKKLKVQPAGGGLENGNMNTNQ